MVQIETGPEQKQPWDQREVIGREETKGVKAQIGREVVGVEKARRCDEPMAQLQIAIGCMAGEVKQKKAPCKAYHRRHLFQPLFQQTRDDHSRTQKRQHAEPNDIRRHEDQRDRRDKRAAPEHHCAPFDRVAAQRQAEAGQQEEHPADGLLPQFSLPAAIPRCTHTKQIDQIPHAMVKHHADQVQPAQLVSSAQRVEVDFIRLPLFRNVFFIVRPAMDSVKQKKLPCSFGTARQLYDNRFRKMQELQLHVEVALQQALEAAAMASLVL